MSAGYWWYETQPAALKKCVYILTQVGVDSGRAGRKGRLKLTSGPGHTIHLAALDQVFDGPFDFCTSSQLPSSLFGSCVCPRTFPAEDEGRIVWG